ncbi:Bacterial mobilization protein (MobC), partial [human gut metagenome]
YDYFLYNLERSGLTKEAYLRKLISDKIPKTKEVGQYEKDILAQLYAIGNNLNQISRRAHSMNVINVEKFFDAVNKFDVTMQEFLERM